VLNSNAVAIIVFAHLEPRVLHHSLCFFASNLSFHRLSFLLCPRSFEFFQSRNLISVAIWFVCSGLHFCLWLCRNHLLLRFQYSCTSNFSCCAYLAVFSLLIGFSTTVGDSPKRPCQLTFRPACSPILFYPDSDIVHCYGRIMNWPWGGWPPKVLRILSSCPFGCSETYSAPSDLVHSRQRLGTL
jgi:hypothetical protein